MVVGEGKREVKNTFTVMIIGILCLSMFWALAPKIKAEGPVKVYVSNNARANEISHE
jgi:hypothetical protein